jgi:D-lyxose ketol-isomerase
MKRSKINQVIKVYGKPDKKEYRFAMPPFAEWTPADWKQAGHEYDEIRDNKLGWDITDFGLGKFDEWGFHFSRFATEIPR